MNEATARIKINKLLERAGWRFFPDGEKPANIRLEQSVQVKQVVLDSLGDDFEKTKNGVMDFHLLDERGFPLIVSGGQIGREAAPGWEGAGPEVRTFSELPGSSCSLMGTFTTSGTWNGATHTSSRPSQHRIL